MNIFKENSIVANLFLLWGSLVPFLGVQSMEIMGSHMTSSPQACSTWFWFLTKLNPKKGKEKAPSNSINLEIRFTSQVQVSTVNRDYPISISCNLQ